MFIDNFSTNSKKKVGDFIEKQYQSPTYLLKKNSYFTEISFVQDILRCLSKTVTLIVPGVVELLTTKTVFPLNRAISGCFIG